MQQQVNHGQVNHGFAAGRQDFVIFTHTSVTPQPREGPLTDPAPRQYLEPLGRVTTLNNLQHPVALFLSPLDQFARVSAIGPDLAQAWKALAELFQDQLGAIAILDVRGVDRHRQQQAEGVGQHVPFATGNFLARVIATWPPFSVVFTDWLSRMAALGLGLRWSSARTRSRS